MQRHVSNCCGSNLGGYKTSSKLSFVGLERPGYDSSHSVARDRSRYSMGIRPALVLMPASRNLPCFQKAVIRVCFIAIIRRTFENSAVHCSSRGYNSQNERRTVATSRASLLIAASSCAPKGQPSGRARDGLVIDAAFVLQACPIDPSPAECCPPSHFFKHYSSPRTLHLALSLPLP